MQTYSETLPPIGYVNFCRVHRADCAPVRRFAGRITLTEARAAELVSVNTMVNEAVTPKTDLELYGETERWTYPAGSGDCEDYVLLKRKILLDHGWPTSALLITVVRDENNEGHAILTVRTDQGDLVLDNKQQAIMPWRDTPYTFVKRQSERNPLIWISLVPPEQEAQTPVSASQSNN
ncbi:transglutaminase-like cysteine peptidase [Methyloligella halotolerans]|nr:transglutaminase-like cysteine peptidase [Methyloligella halotolerans]